MKIKGATQAITVMDKYILVANLNGKAILFALKNESILLVNDYINSFLTKEDFIALFNDTVFEIYKRISDNEDIHQEHIIYKQ
ncbi:MAG TPA: hypothetical protein VJZ51_04590 [Bacilli bacterium]|nr:hypothetical protein [Bacilli bacterium]